MPELSALESLLKLRGLRRVEQWRTVPFTSNNSVADHSYFVAVIAMMIAEDLFEAGASGGLSPLGKGFVANVVKTALLHDAAECIMGDIPHHVKHHNGPEVEAFFRDLDVAARNLVLTPHHQQFLDTKADSQVMVVVKIADMIELGLTAVEELRRGNREPVCVFALRTVLDFLTKQSLAEIEDTFIWRAVRELRSYLPGEGENR